MKSLRWVIACTAIFASSLQAEDALITIDAPSSNSLLGNQWVRAAADGTIPGSIVPLESSATDLAGDVVLVPQNGDSAADRIEAEVAADGSFSLVGATPGVYTIVYRAPSGFAAMALQVVGPESTKPVASTVTISASSLTPQRAVATIARYQPVAPVTDGLLSIEGEVATPPAPVVKQPYMVAQNAAGGLDGRLIRAGSSSQGLLLPAADVNVMLIQSDELVAQVSTAADGTFTVPDLAPGHYNLLASGRVGFAAIGFELTVADATITRNEVADAPFQLTSAVVQGPAPGLEMQIANGDPGFSEFAPPMTEEIVFTDGTFPPGPPGGFGPGGGGFGGGGGGGGLGGGGGGFLGLAAIGGIIAAIALSDDDDGPPPFASPDFPPITSVILP